MEGRRSGAHGSDGPRLDAILDNLPDTIAVTDVTGTIRWVSAGAIRLFGVPAPDLVGTNGLDLFTPESAAILAEGVEQVLRNRGGGLPARLVARRADGTPLPVDIIVRGLVDDPAVGGMLVQIRRVPGEVLADEFTAALATGEPLTRVLQPLVQLAELDLQPARCVIRTNSLGSELIVDPGDGPLPGALTTGWPGLRADHDDREPLLFPGLDGLPPKVAATAREAGFVALWVYPIRIEGDHAPAASLWIWRRVDGPPHASHRLSTTRLRQRIGLALDFDRSHRALARAATRDPLTDAPNRSVFFDQVSSARVLADQVAAVLYLDLDGFKEVNDALGHHVGDGVLRTVADRIRRTIRGEDQFARLGGDEFAVLCPTVDSAAAATGLAERLIEAIAEPMTVDGVACRVGTSVGIALSRPDEPIGASLVVAADDALRRAKRSGGHRWELAEPAP